MRNISDCSRTESVDLGMSPYLYSRLQNKFVVEGCGQAFMMDDHGSVLTGCSSTCSNDTTTTLIDNNKCFGISCCETTIPYYLKSYNMNLTGLESLGGDGPCGFAHLVDKNSYVHGSNSTYVNLSLLWTLSDHDFDQISCYYDTYGYSTTVARLLVDRGNGTSFSSWKCTFSVDRPLQGNPYLIDGAEFRETEECARCRGNGSYCYNNPIYSDDGSVNKWKFTCEEYSYIDHTYYIMKPSHPYPLVLF